MHRADNVVEIQDCLSHVAVAGGNVYGNESNFI